MKTGGLREKNIYKKSSNNNPLFTVITVVYNGEKHIEQTIQSVLDQTYENIEYIIIDGSSKDKTLEIVKKYDNSIDYWISEPDTGIYNAMNKGISLSTGEYIAYLNADDWYNPKTISQVVESLDQDYDYIIGDVTIVDSCKNIITTMKSNIELYKRQMPFGHPALFVKKKIMQKWGFNEKYRIVADYDFTVKLIENNYSYKYLPVSLSNFRRGGVSNTTNTNYELFQIQLKHFGLIHSIYWFLVRTENLLILKLLQVPRAVVMFFRRKK